MDKFWLIEKVLSGNASAAEKAELEDLLVTDPAVRSDYEDMCLLRKHADAVTPNQETDENFYAGLRKIEHTITLLKKKNWKTNVLWGASMTLLIIALLFTTWALVEHRINKTSSVDYRSQLTLPHTLRFDNASFARVTEVLENDFDVRIEISERVIMDHRFTGTFHRGVSVHKIIDVLAQSANVQYAMITPQDFVLTGKDYNSKGDKRIE